MAVAWAETMERASAKEMRAASRLDEESGECSLCIGKPFG
jgi:hypothetical protein